MPTSNTIEVQGLKAPCHAVAQALRDWPPTPAGDDTNDSSGIPVGATFDVRVREL